MKAELTIPVAVKLSPFFTNFAQFARRADRHGANALVLLQSFLPAGHRTGDARGLTERASQHADGDAAADALDCDALRPHRRNLAATSGIHRATDALKMLMAGADVTMLCSVLLRRGIDHIRVIEREMLEWMEEHEYESVEQLKGSMSQKNCPDPSAFERAQYMRALSTYPTANA